MATTFFTSESVTEGHPDKLCDQISDAILDDLIKQDPDTRAGIECVTGVGFVLVTGEVTTRGWSDIRKVVRQVIKEVGYHNSKHGLDYETCAVLGTINEQSPDIAQGVTASEKHEQGAGDQGSLFGYATDETSELMPLPITLAHKLAMRLAFVRKEGIIPYLGPDGKSQVTIEYGADGKPERVDAIVIAAQHAEDQELNQVRADVKKQVIEPVLAEEIAAFPSVARNDILNGVKLHINETGRFVIGGPQADAGLTGRKIIVDTYGGMGRHGGGAFSGKDSSKVDRSGAYMARYIAKNIVAAELAARVEVQISYAIGVAHPVSVRVESFGTAMVPEERIAEAVHDLFDMRPAEMIKVLNLKQPLYRQVAAYGHFGRGDLDLPWEKTDRIDELKKVVS